MEAGMVRMGVELLVFNRLPRSRRGVYRSHPGLQLHNTVVPPSPPESEALRTSSCRISNSSATKASARKSASNSGTTKPSASATASNAPAKVGARLLHKTATNNTLSGGWNPETSVIHSDLSAEVDQAFANVELALRTAGGKGWSQVYKVRMYVLNMDDATVEPAMRNMKKWMPNHQPLLTLLGVKELGIEGMHIEIEVEAHVGNE